MPWRDFHRDMPPYGGALPVPPDAVGRMRLLAIADISQGRLGRKTVFDEIFVTVLQSRASLIDFETEKPLPAYWSNPQSPPMVTSIHWARSSNSRW